MELHQAKEPLHSKGNSSQSEEAFNRLQEIIWNHASKKKNDY